MSKVPRSWDSPSGPLLEVCLLEAVMDQPFPGETHSCRAHSVCVSSGPLDSSLLHRAEECRQ